MSRLVAAVGRVILWCLWYNSCDRSHRRLVWTISSQRPSTVRRPISSKEVKELWSQACMRIGVSSLQDWGLAALQRAVESIQALLTDGFAVIQLTEQLASVQEQIAFLGKIWADGMSLDSRSASFLHCRLRDESLAGISSLGEEQKRRLRVLPMVGDSLFNGELANSSLRDESSQRIRDQSLGDMCAMLQRVATPLCSSSSSFRTSVRGQNRVAFPFASSRPLPPNRQAPVPPTSRNQQSFPVSEPRVLPRSSTRPNRGRATRRGGKCS